MGSFVFNRPVSRGVAHLQLLTSKRPCDPTKPKQSVEVLEQLPRCSCCVSVRTCVGRWCLIANGSSWQHWKVSVVAVKGQRVKLGWHFFYSPPESERNKKQACHWNRPRASASQSFDILCSSEELHQSLQQFKRIIRIQLVFFFVLFLQYQWFWSIRSTPIQGENFSSSAERAQKRRRGQLILGKEINFDAFKSYEIGLLFLDEKIFSLYRSLVINFISGWRLARTRSLNKLTYLHYFPEFSDFPSDYVSLAVFDVGVL